MHWTVELESDEDDENGRTWVARFVDGRGGSGVCELPEEAVFSALEQEIVRQWQAENADLIIARQGIEVHALPSGRWVATTAKSRERNADALASGSLNSEYVNEHLERVSWKSQSKALDSSVSREAREVLKDLYSGDPRAARGPRT